MAPATSSRIWLGPVAVRGGVDMDLLPFHDALDLLLRHADGQQQEVETLAASCCVGRVLARPLIADLAVPPWPCSAMDGYAVRSGEVNTDSLLPVSQRIFAGQAPEPLQPGTCARIFTGASLPEGADAVEMQECVEVRDDGRAQFQRAVPAGRFVRPRGQEALPGQQLLPAGIRLGPVELALAASLGVTDLTVHRRLRVALLSTGDELVEPGRPLRSGQIYNSNRTLLGHWLQQLGCEVLDLGCLPDDRTSIQAGLDSVQQTDVLLGSGGVSVGEADCFGQLLREQGQTLFWRLALKPGKPLLFACYRDMAVLGLPGNPVSSLVTFAMLVRPYLLRRMGVRDVRPICFPVPVDFPVEEAGSRREFMRARYRDGVATLYDNQCSGILSSVAWADGLLELPEGQTCSPGDSLLFYPFAGLLY